MSPRTTPTPDADLRKDLEAAEMASRDRPGEHARTSGAMSRMADETSIFERQELDHWAPPSALTLPPNDDQYVYRWITEYVNGSHVPRRMNRARQEGWQFVTIDQLPEGFYVDEDVKGDGLARVGGLVMAKLPRRFAEQRKRHYEKQSAQMLAGADQLQGVAGKDAVREDRGTRSLDGRAAGDALRKMAQN